MDPKLGAYMLGATLLMMLIEIVCGRHKGVWSRREISLTSLAMLLNVGLTRPLMSILVAYGVTALFPGQARALSGVPLWMGFPVVLFLMEFSFYWVHRWSHEGARGGGKGMQWFWKLHRTHHSAAFMNVTLTVRQNVFWAFMLPTPWVLGISIYLGQEMAAVLSILLIYGWNLITHAHFRWDDWVRRNRVTGKLFRMLEHVIVSPGVHHTHHGYGRDGASYRNYAVFLSCLDWMFGTLHIPQGRPSRYGVPEPDPRVREELFYPFMRG